MLAHGLVKTGADGVGEIQAAALRQHGNTHATSRVGCKKFGGQTLRLPAEDQDGVFFVGRLVVWKIRVRGKKPEMAARKVTADSGKVRIDGQVQVRPVIQAGAPDILLCYFETHFPGNHQGRSGDDAGSGNIPCILRYFWLNQQYSHLLLLPSAQIIPTGRHLRNMGPRRENGSEQQPSLTENIVLDGFADAASAAGIGDGVSSPGGFRHRVFDGNAEAGSFEHGDVVAAVADGNDL